MRCPSGTRRDRRTPRRPPTGLTPLSRRNRGSLMSRTQQRCPVAVRGHHARPPAAPTTPRNGAPRRTRTSRKPPDSSTLPAATNSRESVGNSLRRGVPPSRRSRHPGRAHHEPHTDPGATLPPSGHGRPGPRRARPNGSSHWSCGCERPRSGRAARGVGGAGAAPDARARGGGAGAVAVAPVRHSRPKRNRARRRALRARGVGHRHVRIGRALCGPDERFVRTVRTTRSAKTLRYPPLGRGV